jgi:periplasmic divalent cation tolerance protein
MAALLVLTTAPDRGTARRIAKGLVGARLAACVTQTAACESVYRWKGKIETAKERVLLIKTTTAKYREAERFIRKTHPYESPEIAALRITEGSRDYLKWINVSVS